MGPFKIGDKITLNNKEHEEMYSAPKYGEVITVTHTQYIGGIKHPKLFHVGFKKDQSWNHRFFKLIKE